MKTFPLLFAACLLAIGSECIFAGKPAPDAAGCAGQLVALYEEEILAHDLYVVFGKRWPDVRPFQNIPRSEQMHREAMAGVLKANGVAIPANRVSGTFATPELSSLFQVLGKQGGRSEIEALRAGALIEETDIADLRRARADALTESDKAVFAGLEAASGNHFRAFVRNINARGGAYEPTVLSRADADAILAGSSSNRGRAGCR